MQRVAKCKTHRRYWKAEDTATWANLSPLLVPKKECCAGALDCIGGDCKPPEQGLRQLNDADGVLWYRGFAQKTEREFCPGVLSVLKTLKASQMVVGHNVMAGGKARTFCQKALYMIDVGMSSAYLNADATVWKCHKGNIQILTSK